MTVTGYWLGDGSYVMMNADGYTCMKRHKKRTAEQEMSNVECRRVESLRSVLLKIKLTKFLSSTFVNRHSTLVTLKFLTFDLTGR